MHEDLTPERLDLLLDGAVLPENDAEREVLRLAAALVAAEPEGLPPGLEARLDGLPAAAPKRRARDWLRTRWGRVSLGAAPAVAAAIAVLVIAVKPGDSPAPASWTQSSELAGAATESAPTDLLSDSRRTQPSGAAGEERLDGADSRAAAPPAAAKSALAPPFIETGGRPLRTRSGPGTTFQEAGTLGDGTPLNIACTARGDEVTGPFGPTDIWDRLADGRYVSDAFVFTDTDGPAAAACP
jgi:hypothetical protein